MGLREDMNADMVSNHLNPDEFGEWVTYTPASGSAVRILGAYDEIPLSVEMGVDVQAIGNRPRLIVRVVDLPTNSPRKGDRVTLEATAWHKAGTWRVEDVGNDKLGHVELFLQGPA